MRDLLIEKFIELGILLSGSGLAVILIVFMTGLIFIAMAFTLNMFAKMLRYVEKAKLRWKEMNV